MDSFLTTLLLNLEPLVGAPGWLSQLGVLLLISARVMISGLWDRAPCWALCWTWSLLMIPSLCSSPPCMHAFSLSLFLSVSKKQTNLKQKQNPKNQTMVTALWLKCFPGWAIRGKRKLTRNPNHCVSPKFQEQPSLPYLRHFSSTTLVFFQG